MDMKYYKVKVFTKDTWYWIVIKKHWGHTEIKLSTSEHLAAIVSEVALGSDLLVTFLSPQQFELKEVNIANYKRNIVEFPEELENPFETTIGTKEKYYKVQILGYNKVSPGKDWLYFNGKCFYFGNREQATIFSYNKLNSELLKYYLGRKGSVFLERVDVIQRGGCPPSYFYVGI